MTYIEIFLGFLAMMTAANHISQLQTDMKKHRSGQNMQSQNSSSSGRPGSQQVHRKVQHRSRWRHHHHHHHQQHHSVEAQAQQHSNPPFSQHKKMVSPKHWPQIQASGLLFCQIEAWEETCISSHKDMYKGDQYTLHPVHRREFLSKIH